MPADDRPNLLFVFADQLRARDIDHPAHPLITPAYDRLCAGGTRALNAVSNCPVCTPARAMLLTGQYPLTNRVIVNDLPLPEDALTVGEVLRDAGYRTGYIGKWHLDGVPRHGFTPPGPRRHGFDYWAVSNCQHDYYHGYYYRDDPRQITIDGYEPEHQTSLACDFLAVDDPRPFALFLSWSPPHNPFDQVPAWYRDLYPPELIELLPNVAPPDDQALNPAWPARSLGRLDDPRATTALYYAAISALDLQLMRLLEALEQHRLTERTLTVYTSDHGEMLWSHGRVRKQQPWDESVGIPFVAHWPGVIRAGADRTECFSIADMAPTLLSLLGLRVPEGMEGTDCAAAFRGEAMARPTSSFIMDLVPGDEAWVQAVPEWRGVRTERHTYARLADGTPWVLYDNLSDPYQQTNLAGRPQAAAVQAALEAELQGWLQRCGDPFTSGFDLLRQLGLVPLWNLRERELQGARGRFLED